MRLIAHVVSVDGVSQEGSCRSVSDTALGLLDRFAKLTAQVPSEQSPVGELPSKPVTRNWRRVVPELPTGQTQADEYIVEEMSAMADIEIRELHDFARVPCYH
jgi:hypothetical protein